MASKGGKGLIAQKTTVANKNKDKKRPVSHSSRAGIQFPMGRIHRLLKQRIAAHGRAGATAAVYLASICGFTEKGRSQLNLLVLSNKILQSTGKGHFLTVTNDGITILKSLHIENAAAKVLVDISKVQDNEVGDGTTSVVVLAGELLRKAEKLVASKIHPKTIISGYRMAAECARDALLKKVVDNKDDSEKFRSDLLKIAMTTLCSKILSQDKEHYAKLVVDAVMRLKGSTNLEAIQIIKKPSGSLKDPFLDEGTISRGMFS